MLNSDKLSNLKQISVSEITLGTYLINLGKILEVEEQENCFVIIIDRMNEKQVFKFEKSSVLYII